MEMTGRDPLPYGIAPNRQTLEEVIQYAVEQRIIDRPVTVEELFPPNTHALSG
jgi:4,5-dihydroxyphthalate decarboxylase